MTTTPPEPDVYEFSPGTLTIGQTGTPIDVSCLVNGAKIAPNKNADDATTKLCGTIRPGKITYDYVLSGNVDVDIADATGLFALGWDHAGETCDFTFTPSTEAGTTSTGQLVIDPLEFGGDEAGATMTSDFEFTVIGKPTMVYGTGAGVLDAGPADFE